MLLNDMETKNIVMVGLVGYDFGLGNNCQNIAIEFAKRHRVLFVNPPLDRNTILRSDEKEKVEKTKRVISGEIADIEKVSENLWVFTPRTVLESINWIGIPFLHTILNKVNNKRYARQIRSAANRLGFKDYFLFNDNDIFRSFYLKDLLRPKKFIYYIRDNLTAIGYWRKHGLRLEGKLIAKADVAIANSTYLSGYAAKFNPSSYYVGQGCDLSLFDPRVPSIEPADLAGIPAPRIGYVGNITSLRLDIDLLVFLSNAVPAWSIVLVGPQDEDFKKSALHRLPNVHFLGPKKMEELAKYVAFFDICINPQALNPLTIGNYPRKIDEYLAMGKPVVATKTEAMEAFASHTYLAEKKEDYVRLIRLALSEDSAEKIQSRKEFAAEHTWENNVKEIYKVIGL